MMRHPKKFALIALAMGSAALSSSHASITNSYGAISSEITSAVPVVASTVATVVVSAMAIWGVFLAVRYFKRAVNAGAK